MFCDDIFNIFDEENDIQEVGPPVVLVKDDENEPEVDPSQTKESIPSGSDTAATAAVKRNLSASDGSDDDKTTTPNSKKVKCETEEGTDSLLDSIRLEDTTPRITVHTIEALGCTHEVAVPPDQIYEPLKPHVGKPHKAYDFVLDAFQKEAILCVDNNQSVLVSAHTSAGKTVVAAYAIAKSLHDKQRVIYTTPIKALSNQKYREFFEEFHDVGLVTGDVTINPNASCLIMTTEILRNMLYRGSEVMREVGWVVFDEIHYMRDKERGVVWEETLILLPNNVHHVFLSATIPNARQFAEWVSHLHLQPCHVVYTDFRPVPLQHYIFPAGGDGIHCVVDENGIFKEDTFNAAMAVLQNAGDASKGDQKGRKGGLKPGSGGDSNIFKIVKMIMERNFAPVIIFSFSKKDCEIYAMQMARLDFNSTTEKKLVDEVFNNAMDVLSEEDKTLPQVVNVLPLLRRGIGIHHGGLLPILKETIEILFAEGLIKALFATETFAMGLNMPARTVLFSSPRKFDGKDFRWITSGEYIQMSGRAGRRGLDDKGIVILMIDEKVSPSVGRDIVKGMADPINSAFHLTYNMVLNLLRVEEINPEYMLERSFFQFQNMSSLPHLVQKARDLQEQHDKIKVPKEGQISTYFSLRQQLESLSNEFREVVTQPQYLIPFLQPGRMIKVKHGKDDEFDWGIIINFKKMESGPKGKSVVLIIEALLHCAEEEEGRDPRPCPQGQTGVMLVVPFVSSLVLHLGSLRLYYPKDLRPSDNRKSVLLTLREVKKRHTEIPLLNPIDDMKITDPKFVEIVKKIEAFEERLFAHSLHGTDELEELYPIYEEKFTLAEQLAASKKDVKRAKSLLQMDELKCRKRVLRRLGYCTTADVIEMKGRVACELSSIDELLMTEMMFNGMFNTLTVPQVVALLSCFVCDEKSNEMSKMGQELSAPLRQMQDLARRIAKVSLEAKLEINEDNYVEKFKPFLMDVVHAWCKGASFLQLCEMTDIFEGSIIRCMRRLEETLRQMCQAAKNIGNADLENKFSEGIKLMKRDIVFAASLYL